ncbi:MAG: helix-hairpin-helix domain-containing protein [Thermoproteota archaeon]|nr:helix-hairpin-helix domain-containing protein [Thermoproteota archaeon]
MGNTNAEIANILRKISFLLQMDKVSEQEQAQNRYSGDLRTNFKNRAYSKAADQIENMSIDIETLYKHEGIDGLLKVPSIGKAIASKIEEYIKTGEIQYYNRLASKLPIDLDDFMGLDGIGPKTLKAIYDKVQFRTLEDLKNACIDKKIRNIPGFSQKKEEVILGKIEMHKKGKGRFLLGEVYPLAKQILGHLSELKGVRKAITVGSFRRMKETIGDIDYLVESENPHMVIECFVSMPEVKEILAKGNHKAFVKLNNGIDSDLLVVHPESFGAALQYFTGSKEHGIALRRIAQSKGLRLNEWGLFSGNSNEKMAGKTEEEIYKKLDLEWIPPEMRENKGEIEIARLAMGKDGKKENRNSGGSSEEDNSRDRDSDRNSNILSQLVGYGDLCGDLQVHTNSTDGTKTMEEMAIHAKESFGLRYIAITDHTKSLKITNGLDEKQLLDQASKIEVLNDIIKDKGILGLDRNGSKKGILRKPTLWGANSCNEGNGGIQNEMELKDGYEVKCESQDINQINNNKKDFRILSSAEVNILKDGSLDIASNVLDKLDIVGAAIHSSFSLPEEDQTNRLIKAAQNPSVDIIFHPTGRIINKRVGYPVNISKLIEVAKGTKTVLEIDAHYNRLDLRDEYIMMAVESGVKLVIDSDAHHPIHYAFLELGIAQARRGWAKKKDILNTLPAKDLLSILK